MRFNPRLRMGGDGRRLRGQQLYRGFNPRLRMGGDQRRRRGDDHPGVSIHASAWEATSTGRARCRHQDRFNPRLRMGGDSDGKSAPNRAEGFNPRLRMGGDIWRYYESQTMGVSIHASAWEATLGGVITHLAMVFQSTPPHGRRPIN